MTFRAVEVLKSVDFVIAEDTRVSKKLFDRYEISTPMKSFHGHSSDGKADSLVDEILSGKSAALISDAGTPGISDPGFQIVTRAIDAGVEVVPIPGACSPITALSVSGAPMDKFLYLGFLPVKKGRQTLIKELEGVDRTIVLLESVHRVGKTLSDLYNALGDRYVCIGREMTKMHEEYFRGSLSEACKKFGAKSKGEFVIVIAPSGYKV